MIIITTLLNVIGIICILMSLIIIRKTVNREEYIYEDIKNKYEDIKYYYRTINNVVDSLSNALQGSINIIENYDSEKTMKDNISNCKIYSYPKKEITREKQFKDNSRDVINKIIELKNKGIASKDIAKILNKGVREVEIIIKMLENN